MQNFPFNYEAIPGYMIGGLLDYINKGVPAGGFLDAVLSNDLKGACGKADSSNIKIIPVYSAWLYNNAPLGAYGSPEAVEKWIAKGGLKGSGVELSDKSFEPEPDLPI